MALGAPAAAPKAGDPLRCVDDGVREDDVVGSLARAKSARQLLPSPKKVLVHVDVHGAHHRLALVGTSRRGVGAAVCEAFAALAHKAASAASAASRASACAPAPTAPSASPVAPLRCSAPPPSALMVVATPAVFIYGLGGAFHGDDQDDSAPSVWEDAEPAPPKRRDARGAFAGDVCASRMR